MKIAKDIVIRNIAGEIVLIPTGEAALNANGLITLSESGELLVKQLQNACKLEDLIHCLTDEYDVDEEQAKHDITLFLDKLRNLHLLQEEQ